MKRKREKKSDTMFNNFSSVQLLSHVQLFVSPWMAARKASLSITNSWSLHIFMFIELVMPSNHLILCYLLLLLPSIFPNIRVFQMSQLFASCGRSIGVSASALVLPVNIQDWFPLGWTGYISLQSKGHSRFFPKPLLKSPVLTAASWLAYKFLKRQFRWSCIPISFRIFHILLWST